MFYDSRRERKLILIIFLVFIGFVIKVEGIAGTSSLSGKGEEYLNGGGMYMGSSDLELGKDGSRYQIVGTCFDNVNIPKNSVINSAYINFKVDETKSGNSYLKLKVYGDNRINPALPSSTTGDFSRRPKTNIITWEPSNIGSVGSSFDTCDISSKVLIADFTLIVPIYVSVFFIIHLLKSWLSLLWI